MKLAQALFLIVIALIIGYFLATPIFFLVNKSIKKIFDLYYLGFTWDMLVNNWSKAWASYFLANLLSFGLVFLLVLLPKKQSLYGDARFANYGDIVKMKLFGEKGVIIGKFKNKLLRYNEPTFISLGAPTRSGKGVGIVIPNLLDWGESAVVQDIKQECFDYTSKYRKEILGQDVFLFNPFDKRTHRYNPLAYINIDGDEADAQLMDMANILYPPSDNDITEHFAGIARNLFSGMCYAIHDMLNCQIGLMILQKLKAEIDLTFFGLLQFSEGLKGEVDCGDGYIVKFTNLDDTLETLIKLGVIGKKAKLYIDSYTSISSEKEKGSATTSFKKPLLIFRSDNMRLATSANDFDFRNLRKKKMTIYIGITPDQLPNAKQILNIFWQQLFQVNTKELPSANKELKYVVLLIMDEFTSIGYLAIYLKAIAFFAGYLLKSLMIYQAKSQLQEPQPNGYGNTGAETLLNNHACKIYYTPQHDEAKIVSEALGTKTIKNRSKNLGQGGGGSESDASRALMLPQELEEMAFENEIIKFDGKKPIMANKAFYYNDYYFVNKFKEVSPSLRALDDEKFRELKYENYTEKKSKKTEKRVVFNRKGKIPSKDELESAIQKGETRIEIARQSMQNIKEYFTELYKEENIKKCKYLIVKDPNETEEEYNIRVQQIKQQMVDELKKREEVNKEAQEKANKEANANDSLNNDTPDYQGEFTDNNKNEPDDPNWDNDDESKPNISEPNENKGEN